VPVMAEVSAQGHDYPDTISGFLEQSFSDNAPVFSNPQKYQGEEDPVTAVAIISLRMLRLFLTMLRASCSRHLVRSKKSAASP